MRVRGMHTAADGSLVQANRSAAAALKAMLRDGEVTNVCLSLFLIDLIPLM